MAKDKEIKNSKLPSPLFPGHRSPFFWVMLSMAAYLIIQYVTVTQDTEQLTYSELLQAIDNHQIQELTISDGVIFGQFKNVTERNKKRFSAFKVEGDNKLVEKLQERNIKFSASPPSLWKSVLPWLIPLGLLFLFWSMMMRQAGGGPGGILGMTKSKAKVYVEKKVSTTFADVAGIDEAKLELKEMVEFLKNPKSFGRLGGRAPKGVLLVGPPGTGKTLLARAVAGEANVPFFSINGSEFVELFVGLGAARVRDLFQDARQNAPCILFIDEIDALGKSRAAGYVGGANDEKEQTLNQLLAEMDGFDSSQGVIILAATNRPESLDPALLRAGRFDRQILISNPDRHGRIDILKVHTRKIKLDPKLDLERIASLTPGFSGADLANLVNEAAILATRRNAEFVEEKDFTLAIERLVAGLEQKKKVMNPDEKKRIAYHEMGHATVALCCSTIEKVHKISIIPRGIGALGYTLQRPTEERYLVDEDELINKIAVLLGGRAAELQCFGKVSTGASDDLSKATDIARSMVTRFGMSPKLGLATYEEPRSLFLKGEITANQAYSQKTAEEIDQEVRQILNKAMQLAQRSLQAHADFLNQGALALLEKETLDENDILELWQKYKGEISH